MKKRFLTLSIISIFIILAIFAVGSCGKCEHSWVENKIITPADCENAGTAEMVCESCGETKNDTIAPLGHDYTSSWTWNGVNSASLELVCKRDETHVEVLSSKIGAEVTAPTCTKDGKTTYTASVTHAGKEYKDIIEVNVPLTGEHTYVDGKCTSCLGVDASCSHLDSSNELVNLKEKGTCGGYLAYEKCNDCGFAQITEEPVIACQNPELVDSGVNSYGKNYMVMACGDCGLQIVITSTQNNCVINQNVSLSVNGEAIIDLSMIITDHMSLTQRTVSVNACSGTATIVVCQLCSEAVRIESIDIGCLENSTVDELTITDKNGNEHSVAHRFCADCGVSSWVETWTEEKNCQTYFYTSKKIFNTGAQEILFEATNYTLAQAHEFETRYEFVGEEDCEQGICKITQCTKCRYAVVEHSNSHDDYVDLEIYDLTEEGACGTLTMGVYTCKCGKYSEEDLAHYDCSFAPANKSYKDENGNHHDLTILSCDICGLSLEIDEYYKNEGCQEYEVYELKIIMTTDEGLETESSKVIKEFTATILIDEMHEYELEYELNGESCEDGFTYFYKCKNCDEQTEEEKANWHYLICVDVKELSADGACGGMLVTSSCPCGLLEKLEFEAERYCDEEYSYEEAEDGSYTKYIYTCKNCGRVRTTEEYIVADGCLVTEYEKYTVSFDGKETVLYDIVTDEYYTHGEPEKDLVAGNRQNNYEMQYVCPDCDEILVTIKVVLAMVDVNGKYEYTLTPSVSGNYTIYSLSDIDTLVYLYDARGNELDDDDDGHTIGNNFLLEYYLEANTTYTYSVEYYNKSYSGIIPFVFMNSDYLCQEHYDESEAVYNLDGECENFTITQCVNCQMISNIDQIHASATIDEDGTITVSDACECGKIELGYDVPTSVTPIYVEIVTEDGAGEYEFTPTESGNYTIYSLATEDVCVYLYDSEGNQLFKNDDDGFSRNFLLMYEFEADVTYTLKVEYYDSDKTGAVPFVISQGNEISFDDCEDYVSYEITVMTKDGTIIYICPHCSEIVMIGNQ